MGATLVTDSGAIISTAPLEADLEDPADAGPQHELRCWTVAAEHHRERLDKVLSASIEGFSRNYLRQLVEQGAVRRNGQPLVKPAARVQADDLLQVELQPTPQSRAFLPQPMALELAYCDDDLLIVHKPAGLVVHPAPGNWSGTLLNGLLAWDPRQGDLPRAGIVHRLDKDTSGLMLVARSRPCMDALIGMIARREVQRQYLAIAHQPWVGARTCEVTIPIGRDPSNRLRMAALAGRSSGTKEAHTSIELLVNGVQGCLLQCRLHTGRTHQIRVHLASIGHPLLGDITYGARAGSAIGRQALHAWRLALVHPMRGTLLDLHAPLPADMRAALALWGLRYNRARQSASHAGA